MPPEDDRLFYMWRKIIADYNVSGKNAHDARIVAFMIMHGIKKLYTLNLSDFARFNSIIDLV
jgi:predicted nucleic acid-binding protein